MPASISFSRVSWSTPDGRTLFSDLDLNFGAERTGLIGRNGVGKTTLLQLAAGRLEPQGGKVIVDGRVGVLQQSVRVSSDETVADLFGATQGLALLTRAEQGLASAEDLADADWALDARVSAALAGLGLCVDSACRLSALSGGQRTRAILAALLFTEPDIVLLDEPTNNLVREGRAAVIDVLARWPGVAIVVSHDRELLETMDSIVELTGLGARTYGGNWSDYRERKAVELEAARHELADAERGGKAFSTGTIETLEAGLRAYDGAMLVVSHDEAFLRRIGIRRRIHLSGTPSSFTAEGGNLGAEPMSRSSS